MSSNIWKITRANDFSKFPIVRAINQGVVYALEYGDCIKIGKTQNLTERMKTLTSQAKKYSFTNTGLVAYTEVHSNYSDNEKLLHYVFKDKRIDNGELFVIDLEYFIKHVPYISLKHDVLKDNTEVLLGIVKTLEQKLVNEAKQRKITSNSISIEFMETAKFAFETIGLKGYQLAVALDNVFEKLMGESILEIVNFNDNFSSGVQETQS